MLIPQTKVPSNVGSQETLGHRIRSLRKQARLTQEDIARQMGISRSAVAHWETNREGSLRDYLPQLAKLFDVPLEIFLNGLSEEKVQLCLSVDEIALMELYRTLNVLERLSIQRAMVRLIRKRDEKRTVRKRGRKPLKNRVALFQPDIGTSTV